VCGGHRKQYTLLRVDCIGKPGEERQTEKPAAKKEEAEVEFVTEEKPRAEKKAKAEKPARAKKEATSSAKKAPVKKTESKKK
jgi:hypothetical protein